MGGKAGHSSNVPTRGLLGKSLHPDPFDLIERDLIRAPVVELRCRCAGVVRHSSRLLERAAVLEMGGDPRGPERMIANLGVDAGSRRTAPDHRIGIGLGQGRARKPIGAVPYRAEQRPLVISADAGRIDVGVQIDLEIVVAGHGMRLAAFLLQQQEP